MIMGGISNDETTVEERRQAFHEEWRTFYKRSTPTNKIRELMGVPRIVGQDHEWNLIRVSIQYQSILYQSSVAYDGAHLLYQSAGFCFRH